MIHIDFMCLPDTAKTFVGGEPRATVCGAELDDLNRSDATTATAFESDCNACRTRLNIEGTVKNKETGQTEKLNAPLNYTPGACSGPGKPED